jgi:hypothetical protein
MASSRKPSLLRIYPQTTPSPNDPPGADKFYWALGVAIVAWGRLEGNFLACLMMIIQIAKDKRIELPEILDNAVMHDADIRGDMRMRGPLRRPSTRCYGDSRLSETPVQDSIRLKSAAIWGMPANTS